MLTFTTAEVEVLGTARRLLQDIVRRCTDTSLTVDDARIDYSVPDGMDYGRLAEAADIAENMIFNVLNVAQTYCKVAMTDEQLHGRG